MPFSNICSGDNPEENNIKVGEVFIDQITNDRYR
jgi:hypothetical protein